MLPFFPYILCRGMGGKQVVRVLGPKNLSLGINILEGVGSSSLVLLQSMVCISRPMKCTVNTSARYMKADYFI